MHKRDDMDVERLKNGLIVGLIGAALTLIGDFLIGANPALKTSTGVALVDMFAEAKGNSDLRMALGGFCGAIGLPLEGVGYWRIGETIRDDDRRLKAFYNFAILMTVGLAGAGVHLNCAVTTLLYKWISASDEALAISVAGRFANEIMMPCIVIFGVLLFLALAYLFIMMWRGRTPYPRRAAFFTMPVGVAPAYIAAWVIGSNIVGNAIGTGAISIGNIWMFGGLLWAMKGLGNDTEVA